MIAYTRRDIRKVVGHMKAEATRALRAHGSFLDHTPWGEHGWNVYLDSHDDMHRAIEYVEDNPVRDRLKRQQWSLVVPYDPVKSRSLG